MGGICPVHSCKDNVSRQLELFKAWVGMNLLIISKMSNCVRNSYSFFNSLVRLAGFISIVIVIEVFGIGIFTDNLRLNTFN